MARRKQLTITGDLFYIHEGLSFVEFEKSRTFWIKSTQRKTYANEISLLRQSKDLSDSSSIIKLTPLLDGEGYLRVGGRLSNTTVSPCRGNRCRRYKSSFVVPFS